MMVVLLALLPGYYSLNPAMDFNRLKAAVHQMQDASKEYVEKIRVIVYCFQYDSLSIEAHLRVVCFYAGAFANYHTRQIAGLEADVYGSGLESS